MQVSLSRIGNGLHFEGRGSSPVTVNMDAGPDHGGQDLGARPMELVLMALGSCSAVDIVEILRKQRQELHDLYIDIKAERADTVPAVFTKIHIHYRFSGILQEQKVQKAIELSFGKYCSVSAMLEKTAEIDYSYSIL